MSSSQRKTRKIDQYTRHARHSKNDLHIKLNSCRNVRTDRPRSLSHPRDRHDLVNLTKRDSNQSEVKHSRERKNATHQKSGRSSQIKNHHQISKRPYHKNGETFSRGQRQSSSVTHNQSRKSSSTSLRNYKIPNRKGRKDYGEPRSNRRNETGQEARSNRSSKRWSPRSKHSSSEDYKRSNSKRRRNRSKEKHVINNSGKDSRKRGSTSTNTDQTKKKPRKETNPFVRYDDRLSRLLSKDPSDIMIELLNDHNNFFEFLKSDKLNAKSVEEILEILCNLYETPYTQNFAKIFAGFQDTAFLKHVRSYIFQVFSVCSERDQPKMKTHFERIIRFFREFLNRFPDLCEDLPLDVLLTYSTKWQTDITNNNSTNNSNNSNNNNNNNNNNEELNENNENTDHDITPGPNNPSADEDLAKEINHSVRELISLRDEILRRKLSPNDVSAVKPPDDYKSIPIFPRREDIIPDKPPFLRKNIVKGRYNDVGHYLDVQFRLLREDYIAPIRDGVLEATGIQVDRSRSIHVYRNVQVVGRLLDTKSGGLLYRVKFDVSRTRRVNWEHSKRFKYGSLYCLIDNETRDRSMMYFMTISERNYKDLEKGYLNVKFFEDDRAEQISGEKQFLMIESPAYFECYRHVLEGLQNFNKDNLPFQRYLVECESNVRPPVYLLESTNVKDGDLGLNKAGNVEETNRIGVNGGNKRSNGCYDLSKALECKTARSVSVLDPNAWPTLSLVDLNSSQFNALKAALTQEFVVIQGPPGTGKTFVGLRIASALLTNKSIWRRQKPLTQDEAEVDTGKHSPMLVVCYTNHALDQFLEGILEITDNVVRVGGRSQSESLERFNLKQRKKMTKESTCWRNLKAESKNVQSKIEEERSVIEAASKELAPSKIEQFLNEEEREQLEQWEGVAHQMRMHRIYAWLQMHDQGIVKSEKRKRSSTTGNEDTKCDKFTAKRLRNTVHSERNPTEDEEQVHNRNSSTTPVHLPALMSLSIPVEYAQKSNGDFDELEEGELPDSDDGVFYQSNYTLTTTDATTMNDDDLTKANHLEQYRWEKTETFGYNLTIQAQEFLFYRIQDSTMVKTITNYADSKNVLNTALSNKVIKPERVNEPSSSLAPPENKNIACDGIDQKDILDDKDYDMFWNKHSKYERNEKLGNTSRMLSSSASNSGERNDKEKIVDNETNLVVIDKHSNDERYKGNTIDPTMSVFEKISSCSKTNDKEDIVDNTDNKIVGGKNSNDSDKEGDSYGKRNDIFAEDVEEGEILDTEDDVTDGDDDDDDDQERGRAIDLTTIFKQNIILEGSKSAEKCSSGNVKDISKTKCSLENVKHTNGTVKQNLGVGQKNTLSAEDGQNQENEPEREEFKLKALSKEQRSELYKEWVGRYFEYHSERFNRLRQRHDEIMKQLSEIGSIQVEGVLKNVDVIGMTTTGAAKHRLTLQQIKPRIVIVEEAAEVLEGHVITALSSGTDHLILIGDHKQLKPNPAVFELARKYNLDVSLFERMVANGLTCHSLDTQHRMRPEIADIMRIIYPNLVDDVSVKCYRDVTGIQQTVYFIDHDHPESGNEELKSPSNNHETAFVAALCKYLLLQGYQGNTITVLTMYTGQLLQLKRCIPKEFGVRVSSVDNFQGEESDIIILSLVRSNKNGNIGFLNVSNRVCVALSRAKKAMYCIGNISMMAEKNKLWGKIKYHLQQKDLIGKSLPLRCPNHPEKKIEASSAEDFKKAPEGGCLSPCEFRLSCGHVCSLKCHSVDQKHEKYRCTEKCREELCDLKHPCKKLCHFNEDCGLCEETISFVVPTCKHQHEVQIKCYQREKIICPEPCTNKLPCGHGCTGKCGQDCDSIKCQEKVARTLQCGHEAQIPCSVACSDDVKSYRCRKPCQKLLECDHKCPGDCSSCYEGTFHVQCKEPCKRPLVCSHECEEPCTRNCPPCRMPCENRCPHSCCRRRCGELCVPCRMPCKWSCEHHQCQKTCGEMCERKKCNKPCLLPLSCGHQCVGVCGDYCPRLCRICDKQELQTIFFGREDEPDALYIELVDCGHVFEVEDLDRWMEAIEEDENVEIQLKVCPKCKTPVRRSLRYGNVVKKTLADIENVKKIKLEEQEQLQMKWFQLRRRVDELAKKCGNIVNLSRLLIRVRELRSDANEYNTLENQLHFIPCLAELDELFFNGSEDVNFVAPSSKLLGEKNRIRELLHGRRLLTDQEIKDISENIAFLSLRCQFQRMLRKIEENNSCSLSEEIKSSVESAKEIMSRQDNAIGTVLAVTDVERAVVASLIEDVNKKIGVVPLSPKERADIVKAINLSKGHWFKCPNGHFYVITECGGAMQKANCPECHEVIGGSNHQLVEGNQLAPEMDGALHPAWSDQTNLLNYDPEVLRRLRR